MTRTSALLVSIAVAYELLTAAAEANASAGW